MTLDPGKSQSGAGLPLELRARADEIVDWLLEERLQVDRTTFLVDRFCRRLVEAGLPLDRVNLAILQLDPKLRARGLHWDREAGGSIEQGVEHGFEEKGIYLDSPVRRIFEGSPPIRRKIEEPGCPIDFPVVSTLQKRGFTDYFILPFPFSTGRINAIGFASKQLGGFSDRDVAIIETVLPAFGAVMETRHLMRTARQLLDTYVGHSTGRRILNGSIKRGDGDQIHAAIWFCDLRGFTDLSGRLSVEEVTGLLNDYFDCMAAPIEAHGGEILKFIGDAVLAIFPCETTEQARSTAADKALSAADAAVAALAELNDRRKGAGQEALRCGIALHIGEVMYGNIGSGKRLDFTVIGPAVNLVARLEPLCAQIDGPLVASEAIAEASSRQFECIGQFALKGIAGEQRAYAPQ